MNARLSGPKQEEGQGKGFLMYCKCGGKSKVITTYDDGGRIIRKRRCTKCNRVFYTGEEEIDYIEGVDSDHRRNLEYRLKRKRQEGT